MRSLELLRGLEPDPLRAPQDLRLGFRFHCSTPYSPYLYVLVPTMNGDRPVPAEVLLGWRLRGSGKAGKLTKLISLAGAYEFEVDVHAQRSSAATF